MKILETGLFLGQVTLERVHLPKKHPAMAVVSDSGVIWYIGTNDSMSESEFFAIDFRQDLEAMRRGIASWVEQPKSYHLYACTVLKHPIPAPTITSQECEGCPLISRKNTYCPLTYQQHQARGETEAMQERANFRHN